MMRAIEKREPGARRTHTAGSAIMIGKSMVAEWLHVRSKKKWTRLFVSDIRFARWANPQNRRYFASAHTPILLCSTRRSVYVDSLCKKVGMHFSREAHLLRLRDH